MRETISDSERREVARRLREIDYDSFSSYGEEYEALYRAIGLYDGNSEEEWPGRLADLIEPQPERTCRIEVDVEKVETDLGMMEVREYWCSECYGRMMADDDYCPRCGAKVVE